MRRRTMDRSGFFRKIWAVLGTAMAMRIGAMAAIAENPVGWNGRVPPIDRHIPARIETATFALG